MQIQIHILIRRIWINSEIKHCSFYLSHYSFSPFSPVISHHPLCLYLKISVVIGLAGVQLKFARHPQTYLPQISWTWNCPAWTFIFIAQTKTEFRQACWNQNDLIYLLVMLIMLIMLKPKLSNIFANLHISPSMLSKQLFGPKVLGYIWIKYWWFLNSSIEKFCLTAMCFVH